AGSLVTIDECARSTGPGCPPGYHDSLVSRADVLAAPSRGSASRSRYLAAEIVAPAFCDGVIEYRDSFLSRRKKREVSNDRYSCTSAGAAHPFVIACTDHSANCCPVAGTAPRSRRGSDHRANPTAGYPDTI